MSAWRGVPRRDSWGRYPISHPACVVPVFWRDADLRLDGRAALPYGLGRSYGDSCLNDRGLLLETRPLDRFIAFDPATGITRCEAGVTLAEIIAMALPHGWFLPVTPGTKFVTLGGAIANDVHGKNHHRAGTFGCHLRSLELLRSDGSRVQCSPAERADLFAATVGGLGLTGLVLSAELALRPVPGPWIAEERIRFGSLDAFFALAEESDASCDYTVAWIDCLARGPRLGRGVFIRGNHESHPGPGRGGPTLRVPIDAPRWLLARPTVEVFNTVYYHRHRPRARRRVHYDPFFYPLDAIHEWNRLYGRGGLLQHQCVVPPAAARPAIREILERTARSGLASPLSVLKRFGSVTSPGLLSFPRPGVTLTLDFPNRGPRLFTLLEELDRTVREAGGAVYPAKDARMSPETFRASFPRLDEFRTYVDPCFSSNLWRRVRGGAR